MISARNLTLKRLNTATSTATSSITPLANRLVLCLVSADNSTSVPTPTVTGCGLTWVLVTSVANGGGDDKLFLFRAMGPAPTAGAVTVSFGATTVNGGHIVIDEFAGVDTAGTDGSGAIVQYEEAGPTSAASITVTLAAFSDEDNATYGGFRTGATAGARTGGTGFTVLADDAMSGPSNSALTEWKNANDTTVDATLTSSSDGIMGIAVELAILPAPPPPKATELVWVYDYLGDQTMAINALFALELEDRLQDSEALRFTIAADDPKAGFVGIDCIARYRQRYYRIGRREPNRDGTRVTIDVEAEALWIDLGGRLVPGHFLIANQTPATGLDLILLHQDYGWSVGTVDGPPFAWYGIDKTDGSILEMLRDWAKITGCELVFDTALKTVSLIPAQGETRDLGFRYAWNLSGITRRETPPAVTRLYAYGRNGLTISAVNPNGTEHVEDFSFYEAQGLTLDEAKERFTRERVWKDDSFISDGPLYEAAVARLTQLSQPITAYEAKVVDLTGTGQPVEAGIGDIVPVRDSTLGISIKTRVVRLLTHPLAPNTNEIELEYLLGRPDDSSANSGTGSGINGEDWRLFLTRSAIDRTADDATVQLLAALGIDFAAGPTGVAVTETAPVEVTLLAENVFAGGTASWVTDSYTPEADALLLAFITTAGANTDPPDAITGNGLTWVLVEDVAYNATVTAMWVYRAMGPSPSAGALTVTPGHVDQAGQIHVVQATGVNTSGINGAGAVEQAQYDRADESTGAQPAGPTITVSLSSSPSSKNAIVAALNNTLHPAVTITPGDGFAELGQTTQEVAIGASSRSMISEWKSPNDGSADASTPGHTTQWMGVAVELVGEVTTEGLSGTGEAVHHFDAVGIAAGTGKLEIRFVEEISGDTVGPVVVYDFADAEDVHVAATFSIVGLEGNQMFSARAEVVSGTGTVEFLTGEVRYSILAKGALGAL